MIDLKDDNILNVYRFGSHVYGTNRPDSDEDFIIIVKDFVESDNIDIHYITEKEFLISIDNHDIRALECIFLPSRFILKNTIDFRSFFNLNKTKLRKAISTISDGSWVKGKKKLTVLADYDKKIAIKSIFHSLRIRDIGIQVASNGTIISYSRMNYILDELYKLSETYERTDLWNKIDDKYRSVYKELRSSFVKLCPKEKKLENEELDTIINSYKWIKVKRYKDVDMNDDSIDFKSEYEKLNQHHIEETKFLIEKCRELAQQLKDT
jgi:hypothetical protein